MSHNRRVTNEQVIQAYQRTGSVWKAAKELGVVGQSVWERLQRLGFKMPSSVWTAEELLELRRLAESCAITEIAQRLGRPYYGVAIKLSRLGLAKRFGNRIKRIKPIPGELSRTVALKYAQQLPTHRGPLRQFAKQHSVSIGTLVAGLHKHAPEVLQQIAEERGLQQRECPHCHKPFLPLTTKQQHCSARCSANRKKDLAYFGGKRANTHGLAEGVCQVCGRQDQKGLSSHHVFGKENDPENEALIAACPGCHSLIGRIAATLSLIDSPAALEALITFALLRRFGAERRRAVHVTVEWDWLTDEDVQDLIEGGYLE